MKRGIMAKLDNIDDVSCDCGPACCGGPEEGPGGVEKREAELGSARWISGRVETPCGGIPVVPSRLAFRDRLGGLRVRWGIGRMAYAVPPGLYAVGAPDSGSSVFVTANYKLSFDALRSSLGGLNAWILVLDTKGINVWCAAGKKTFGTDEVVRRVEDTGLARVVAHRTLVLPQLGASNVAAHEVAKRTRFKVVYGPVRAADLKAFVAAGMRATPEMRLARFAFKDRLILTPVELSMIFRSKVFLAFAFLWALGLFGVKTLRFDGPAVLGAIVVGSVLVPLLLPWIPGRAFAWKGWLLGVVWAAAVLAYRGFPPSTAGGWSAASSYVLILPAVSAFLAMSFTGSSTFTSLSGVVKEMKTAVPLIAASAALGVVALVVSLFING